MNVGGIAKKITNKADLIGVAAGALAFGLDELIENLKSLPNAHIPDVGQVLNEAFRGAMGEKVQDGAMLYAAGWIAKEMGFSIGTPIQKFSVGYLKGLALQHVLHFSTHSPKGYTRTYPNEAAIYQKAVGYGY